MEKADLEVGRERGHSPHIKQKSPRGAGSDLTLPWGVKWKCKVDYVWREAVIETKGDNLFRLVVNGVWGQLHFAAVFEGLRHRYFVGVVEVAAYGDAHSDAGDT